MTQEELARLTPEERERLARAEQEALAILNRRMSEGRRFPRRHMRFALLVIAAIFAVSMLFYLVSLLFA